MENEEQKVGLYYNQKHRVAGRCNTFPTFADEDRFRIKSIVTTDDTDELEPLAFGMCKRATTAVIGENVTNIPSSCFNGCFQLKHVTFNGKIERIGDEVFSRCISLVAIHADLSNLIEIGDFAFYHCFRMKELDLSKCTKLKRISKNAFRCCYAKVILPEGFNLAKND